MADSPLFLVGVDGSEPSRRAVTVAARLAARCGGRLLIAHIIHWSGFTPLSLEEALRRPIDKKREEETARGKILAPLLELATAQGVEPETYYSWGSPAESLNKLARDRDAELIVVGRRGHSNIAEIILGSVSNAIAHMSDLPVLLVP